MAIHELRFRMAKQKSHIEYNHLILFVKIFHRELLIEIVARWQAVSQADQKMADRLFGRTFTGKTRLAAPY